MKIAMDADSAFMQAERMRSGVEPDFGVIVKPHDKEEYGNAEKACGNFAAFFGLVVLIAVHVDPVRSGLEKISEIQYQRRILAFFLP